MKRAFPFTLLFLLLALQWALGQIPKTMSYQGILTDTSGTPVPDGTYDLTFKLYESPVVGSNPIWTETHADLEVNNGKISAILGSINPLNLPFDKPYWLGMAVNGGAELTPRIELTAAAYTLGGAAGTECGWIDAGAAVHLTDSTDSVGIGTAIPTEKLEVSGTVKMLGFKMPSGAAEGYVLTSDISGTATWQPPPGGVDNDWTISGNNMYAAVSGNVGIGTALPQSKLSVGGNGFSGTGIFGQAMFKGVYGKGSPLMQAIAAYGVYGEADGWHGRGVYGEATGTGNVKNYGGFFVAKGDSGHGVYGEAQGSQGIGILGNGRLTGVYGKGLTLVLPSTTYGVYGEAGGWYGRGVYGEATGTGNVKNYGGYFVAKGDSGYGVYGEATGLNGRGICGVGKYGVYGQAVGTGDKWAGYFNGNIYTNGNVGIGTTSPNSSLEVAGTIHSTSGGFKFPDGSIQTQAATGFNLPYTGTYSGSGDAFTIENSNGGYAIKGRTSSGDGGVQGYAYSTIESGRGIFGEAAGARGRGVMGVASNTGDERNYGGYFLAGGKEGIGAFGFSTGTSGAGVMGYTVLPGNYAVYGLAELSSGCYAGYFDAQVENGIGIYAIGGLNGTGYAAKFDGRTSTKVLEITGGSDLSEQFEIRSNKTALSPSAGMVVCIDPDHPGELMVSSQAYDRRVAGIISGAGGIKPGMLMGQQGSEADGNNPVALTGRVYCRADASRGAIGPGDLLTTSEIPGHAMKVTDYSKAQGAIIGKAMTALEEGQGLVLVLVTLQ